MEPSEEALKKTATDEQIVIGQTTDEF